MASPTERARPGEAPGSPTAARGLTGSAAAVTAVAVVAGLALLAMLRTESTVPAQPPNRSFDPPAAANPTRPVQPPRALLGAGSCTSSGCHASPVEGHAAWQSSYTVWATRDPHARAERVLHEPLAAQIVALLATRTPTQPPVPAHEHTACIGCHATGRGPLARDGVSCESCHGPAGDWLVAHTLPGWHAAGNTLGMVDLADPFVCGQQCAGCHVGGPPTADGLPREVSHDLIAAGHPRLAFELRSFKQAEPPHWRDRFARGEATAPGKVLEPSALDPLDEWALGRLGAVHVFLDQIARQTAASTLPPEAGTAAVWPEFTAFDCYGCHRPPVAAVDRDAPPTATPRRAPLGTPRLEPLHLALLDIALPAEVAARLTAFRADVEQRWWQQPDGATIVACLDAIDAARAHVHPALSNTPAGTVAARVVGQVDPSTWDEAAAAHSALEALVARAVARGTPRESLGPAVARLEKLRGLLEFPASTADRPERFDSPHQYDARAVATELKAIAAALEAVR